MDARFGSRLFELSLLEFELRLTTVQIEFEFEINENSLLNGILKF